MGLLDGFTSDGTVDMKHTEYYRLMREAAKAELMENAARCNVDHVLCMRNHEYMDESIDTVGNMLPSCGCCNRYKSTYDLETFRRMLSGIPRRLARDVGTYNIAVRYGMVEEHHGPVRFYFEKAVPGQPETGGGNERPMAAGMERR